MRSTRRTRFWVETGLAAMSATLLVVTLLRRDWIEVVFGIDGDSGDGSLEWVVSAALLATTLLFALLARAETRKAVLAPTRTN